MRRLLARAAIATIVLSTGTVVLASPATAATSCYGGAVTYTRFVSSGGSYVLPSTSSYFTTSSRCNDINLRFTSSADRKQARACWGSTFTTCSTWKLFDGGDENVWKVIASTMLDGTKFRLEVQYYGEDPSQNVTQQVAF